MTTSASAAADKVARPPSAFTRWLQTAPRLVFVLYGGLMAFGAYFAMYAFRKPFTAADFADVAGFIVDYKIALVIAQVFGYALSKLIGIKFVSELPANRRAVAIIILVSLAELALVGFGFVKPPYNVLFLFPERPAPGHDLGPGLRLSRRPADVRNPGLDPVRQLHRLIRPGQVRRQMVDAPALRQRIHHAHVDGSYLRACPVPVRAGPDAIACARPPPI